MFVINDAYSFKEFKKARDRLFRDYEKTITIVEVVDLLKVMRDNVKVINSPAPRAFYDIWDKAIKDACCNLTPRHVLEYPFGVSTKVTERKHEELLDKLIVANNGLSLFKTNNGVTTNTIIEVNSIRSLMYLVDLLYTSTYYYNYEAYSHDDYLDPSD